MNERKYKYFDTTADIGIIVKTDNLTEAYIASAQATINLITDTENIEENIAKKVSITSEDEFALLYDWITELLILLDSENFMAKKFDIDITKKDNKYKLSGTLLGDSYDTKKYIYKTEVKAITYHEMDVKIKSETVCVKFILDL